MYSHERKSLDRITENLRERLPGRVLSAYAFGSRVRGDHDEWSDFDVLVVVKDRDVPIEHEIIDIFVDEELESGILFTPLIKDDKAFDFEREYNSPFYQNIMREGVAF